MLIRRPDPIRPSQITAEQHYLRRRDFIKATAGLSAAAIGSGLLPGCEPAATAAAPVPNPKVIPDIRKSRWSTDAAPTEYKHITTYNNFVELGDGKSAPARNADHLRTRPWTIQVSGECEAPGEIGIEDLLTRFPQEERIYRFRCVEAWGMVIPWVGLPLRDLLRRFKPTSKAKYVAFETLYDPKQLPGQRSGLYDWPYREGLRMDEAMHALTILATGLYGRELPNQNGAPIRLVVPWKYGFKSIKSIVAIRFTEHQPPATWNMLQPDEYGFYANVNPNVDHPRWSQKQHRVIGAGLFAAEEPTLMFNGYADQVAHLYGDMDLRRYF
jgi:sulfoxide reductase catalytic subunit YedY